MLRYSVDRIVSALPLLLIVSIGTFCLTYLMPGDPAAFIAGDGATPDQVATIREDMGLDRPLPVQYWAWISGIVVGDFGTSYSYNAPVSFLLLQRAEVTISLVVVGFIIAAGVGIVLGVLSGLRPGGLFDRATTLMISLGLAAPTYWIAILFIIVFSLTLRWFPATGYSSLGEGFQPWLTSIILPACAMAVTSIADISRQVRSTVSGVKDRDFIRTAHSLGLPNKQVIIRHVGRNSGVPTATILGLQVERLIGAAIVIELLFAMPGFGQLLLNAVLSQDLPVIQVSVLLIAAIVICTNLVVDLSYSVINPRIRVN